MAEYKRQHYVPKLVLRNFRSTKNGLFYFNKDNPNKGVEQRNIDGIFQSTFRYSPIAPGGEERAIEYEKEYLGLLDDTFAPIVKRWCEEIISGNHPVISQEDKWFVNVAFQLHMKKSPEFSSKVHDIVARADSYESALEQLEIASNMKFGDEAREQFAKMGDPLEFLKYYAVLTQLLPQPEMEDTFFSNTTLYFAVPQNKKNSFIIGSRFVYPKKKGSKSCLTTTQAEFWMPIHPKVSVVLVHGAKNMKTHVFDVEPIGMRRINLHVMESSTELGSHSVELLKSLLNNR
jgi:hypothetical protein